MRKDPTGSTRAEPSPVGVCILPAVGSHSSVPVYAGVSYCDAVRRAGQGEVLRVLPGSIQVCGWAPVVLGLKSPDGAFERGLGPRLPFPVAGLLLAPLDRFPGEPQVVVVMSGLEQIRLMVALVGEGCLWESDGREPDRSVVSQLRCRPPSWRHRLVGLVNHPLAGFARSERWQGLTRRLFRSRRATQVYDALISHTMADMSVCRNSTAIPLLSGRVNVSFFCSGGITWGRNDPNQVTSGWPQSEYPGRLTS
jgi:uncharacterized protein (DUF169 family)